jgi:hypothetical protein
MNVKNCSLALPAAEKARLQFPQRSENARISVSPQRFLGTARRSKPPAACGKELCRCLWQKQAELFYRSGRARLAFPAHGEGVSRQADG